MASTRVAASLLSSCVREVTGRPEPAGWNATSLIAFGHQLEQIAERVAHVQSTSSVDRRLVDDFDAMLEEVRAPAFQVVDHQRRMTVSHLWRHVRPRLDVQLGAPEGIPDSRARLQLGRPRHFVQAEAIAVEL